MILLSLVFLTCHSIYFSEVFVVYDFENFVTFVISNKHSHSIRISCILWGFYIYFNIGIFILCNQKASTFRCSYPNYLFIRILFRILLRHLFQQTKIEKSCSFFFSIKLQFIDLLNKPINLLIHCFIFLDYFDNPF
jgi:hypothetical protein